MNRRQFLQSGVLATAGSVLAGNVASGAVATRPAATAPVAKAIEGLPAPVLLRATATSVDVAVALPAAATAWVEYGPTRDLGQVARGADGGLLPYDDLAVSIPLRNLPAGRECFYRVCARPVQFARWGGQADVGPVVATEVRSFRTLNPAAESASFVVWNDTHEKHDVVKSLAANYAAGGRADLLVWNGDITNYIGDEAKIVREYLTPAGVAFADRTPALFVRGNHDVRGAGARLLTRHLAGPGGQWYYHFRQGPVACLVLDTGEDKPDDHVEYCGLVDFEPYLKAQREWAATVAEDEAFRSAPFRVVFMHIPAYRGVPYRRPPAVPENFWDDVLTSLRVDLVVSGHTHVPAYHPASAGRPWPQIIGGGPQMERATQIAIRATGEELVVESKLLSGKVLTSERFGRRA